MISLISKGLSVSATDFVTGKIILDSMGDRIPEFWLLDMNNEAQFQVAMNISVDIIDNNHVRVSSNIY